MKTAQLSLAPRICLRDIKVRTHGGVSLKKRRKLQRPLRPNLVTHVVFKSSKARGELSFYKHKKDVAAILRKQSRKFFIEVLDWVNMGNHIHLKIRFKDPERAGKFFKSVAGMVARKITGARKGFRFGKFWDGLVYTRVLTSRLEELGLRGYFEGNHRERELGPLAREEYLQRFNQFIYRLRQVRARSEPDL